MDAQTFADEVRADHARPIHPDDRELQFKEVLSFHASEKVLQRRLTGPGGSSAQSARRSAWLGLAPSWSCCR